MGRSDESNSNGEEAGRGAWKFIPKEEVVGGRPAEVPKWGKFQFPKWFIKK